MTVLIALTVTAAALVSSQAAGRWSSALTEEIKRSAATVEILAYVYGDEAPLAFQISLAEARAHQLRRHAVALSTGSALAAAESITETRLADGLRQAHRATNVLIDGDRYRMPGGGYDVARRVGDEERAAAELIALDPDRTQASGDQAQRWATVISAVAFPLILGYLVLAVRNQRRRRSRRTPGDQASATDNVGLIPQPPGQDSHGRFAIALPLLAWTILTAITPAQLYFANQGQRATNLAARYAIQATTDIAGSHALSTFRLESERILLIIEGRSYARELALGRQAISIADRAALPRLRQVAATMARPPDGADGVSARTREVVTSGVAEWARIGRAQNEQADLAEHAGRRSSILQLALLLTALSLSLFALAATQSFGGSTMVSRAARGLLLAASIAVGVTLALP